SDTAYAAADKITDFTVKAKHLMSHQQGFSKFTTDSQQQVQAWVQQALQSSNAMFMPDPNNAGRFQTFVDMGQVIGTKGQQIIKIVVTEAGRIITAYPVRGIR
ncbi:MAG: SAR2788 family putative toxin, partial [Bacillota bacterium]|nr:SAR2788 family putative toxin [Bacillota bacterium]